MLANGAAEIPVKETAATRPMGPEHFISKGMYAIREKLRGEELLLRTAHWKNSLGLWPTKKLIESYNSEKFRWLITLTKLSLKHRLSILAGFCSNSTGTRQILGQIYIEVIPVTLTRLSWE